MQRQAIPLFISVLCVLVLGAFGAAAAHAAEVHPGEAAFARGVAKRHANVSVTEITAILDQAERKQSIIDAMTRPAEAKPWSEYRPIFLTPTRIAAGVAFYQQNRALLERVADKYAVDPEYIVAILGVESNYGLITGNYKVIDALVTLAFYYPSRAEFFRAELERLLTMPARQLPGPVSEISGSYAGAMGWGQFMPSSIAAYARDEDDDEHIDLIRSLPDILASVANYLAEHGWARGAPVAVRAQAAEDAESVNIDHSTTIHTVGELEARGYAPTEPVPAKTEVTLLQLESEHGVEDWITFDNFYVITRYNHSPLYAMAVHQLASSIAAGVRENAVASSR